MANSKIIRPEPVVQPPVRIIVPHNGKEITFVFQEFGPYTYANIGTAIAQAKLARPSAAETASLLYRVYDNKDPNYKSPEFSHIRKRMKSNWIWAFTGTLWAPEGAYIQDDLETREGMPFMEKSELVKKLESKDPSVRFVPYGFKTGSMSSLELSKNSYVIGLVGEEGADKLARVADTFQRKPYLYTLTNVTEPQTRVTALNSGWGIVDLRLDVDGDVHGDGRYGYGLGVFK